MNVVTEMDMLQENLTLYKVFLASPSDVATERAVAFEVINELNRIYESQNKNYRLEIRAWEKHSHPDLGLPQEVIKRQIPISKCDIFIGIFWRQFGMPTGSMRPGDGRPYLSGTQQEVEEAIAARKAGGNQRPVIILYQKLDQPSHYMGDEDILQYSNVIKFFQECEPGGEHPALIWKFERENFSALLKQHLLQTMVGFETHQIEEKTGVSHQRDFKVLGQVHNAPTREIEIYNDLGRGRSQVKNENPAQVGRTAASNTVSKMPITFANLRRHLQHLDSVEIETLCLDRFPAVYDKFSRGLRRDEMINLLFNHCRHNREAAKRLSTLSHLGDENKDNWFDDIGLRGNPFQYLIAEEDEDIVNYRVQPQMLKPIEAQLRGDDAKGRWIIFAKKGHGKTALRQMIEQRHFPQKPGDDVLCITCDLEALERVSGYANRSLKALNSGHYVRLIQELVLESIESTSEYYTDFREFLSPSDLQATSSSSTTAHQKLKALARRVRQWRFKGVLCLVDQVDEVLIAEAQPENMLVLIKPLMYLSLQVIPGIAFRYFLPSSLEPLIQGKHDVFRLDRYYVYALQWTEADLQLLIAQRLSAFSVHQINAYSSLGQLCDPEHGFRASVDQALIRLAEGCPRAVIWLANCLIQMHCQAKNPPRFIQPVTWEKVRVEWWQGGRARMFGSLTTCEGFVLVGERIYFQGQEIVLSEKYDALLRCLINARGGLRSKEDLMRAGWPGEKPEGISDAALAEAMRRMKNELDEQDCDPRWVNTVRGRGYRLRKPRDTKQAIPDSKPEGGVS